MSLARSPSLADMRNAMKLEKMSNPDTEETMPRLTIRLSAAEKRQLEALATRSGRTVSDLARLAISDLIAHAKQRKRISVEIDLTDEINGRD